MALFLSAAVAYITFLVLHVLQAPLLAIIMLFSLLPDRLCMINVDHALRVLLRYLICKRKKKLGVYCI